MSDTLIRIGGFQKLRRFWMIPERRPVSCLRRAAISDVPSVRTQGWYLKNGFRERFLRRRKSFSI